MVGIDQPDRVVAGESAVFTATDVPAGVDSVQWDFGDGSTGRGTTESHSYATAGDFEITVRAVVEGQTAESATETVTVAEREAADIVVDAFAPRRLDVVVGETVGVEAVFSNRGGQFGTADVPLFVDGEEAAVYSVALAAGGRVTREQTITVPRAGTIPVSAGQRSAELSAVAVETTGLVVDPESPRVGQPATVRAVLTASGDRPVTESVAVVVDGQVQAERTVEIPAGGSAELTASVTFDELGTATVTVAGQSTTVQVGEAAVEFDPGAGSVEDGILVIPLPFDALNAFPVISGLPRLELRIPTIDRIRREVRETVPSLSDIEVAVEGVVSDIDVPSPAEIQTQVGEELDARDLPTADDIPSVAEIRQAVVGQLTTREIGDLGTVVDRTVADATAAVSDARDELDESIAETEEDLRGGLQDVESEVMRALSATETAVVTEVGQAVESVEVAVTDAETAIGQELADVGDEIDGAITDAADDLQDSIDEIDGRLNTIAADLQAIDVPQPSEIEAALDEALDDIEDRVERFSADVGGALDGVESEVDGLGEDLEATLESVERDIDERIDDLRQNVDDSVGSLESDLISQLDAGLGDVEARLSRLQEEVAGDVGDLTDQVSQSADRIVTDLRSDVEALRESVESDLQSVSEAVDSVRETVDSLDDRIPSDFEGAVESGVEAAEPTVNDRGLFSDPVGFVGAVIDDAVEARLSEETVQEFRRIREET